MWFTNRPQGTKVPIHCVGYRKLPKVDRILTGQALLYCHWETLKSRQVQVIYLRVPDLVAKLSWKSFIQGREKQHSGFLGIPPPDLDNTFLEVTTLLEEVGRLMLFETIVLYQGIYIPRTLYCDSSELKARRGGNSMTAIHSRKLSPLVTKPDGENTYKAIWRQPRITNCSL